MIADEIGELLRQSFVARVSGDPIEAIDETLPRRFIAEIVASHSEARAALTYGVHDDAPRPERILRHVAEAADLLTSSTTLSSEHQILHIGADASALSGLSANASTLIRRVPATGEPGPATSLEERLVRIRAALLRRAMSQLERTATLSSADVEEIDRELREAPILAPYAAAVLELLRGARHLAHGLTSFDGPDGDWENAQAAFSTARRLAADHGLPAVSDAAIELQLQGQLAIEHSSTAVLRAFVQSGAISEQLGDLLVRGTPQSYPRYELWPPQREFVGARLSESDNFVVALPTSAGKTSLAELLIARWLTAKVDSRIVYLVPSNALAYELGQTFGSRFADVAAVEVLTGSYDISTGAPPVADERGQILITTPERFDGMLRGRALGDDLALQECDGLVADEVHLLNQRTRGVTIEHVLARVRGLFPDAQVLGISGVLANPDAVSMWLSRTGQDRHFARLWRPTRIREAIWRHDGSLLLRSGETLQGLERPGGGVKEQVAALLGQLERGGWAPAMVVADKRWCPTIANALVDALDDEEPSPALARRRADLAQRIEREYWPDFSLATTVRAGVGYHHADLTPGVRAAIVEALDAGVLRAVVATTTLAEGVNLPFRVVVFHSTRVGGGLSALLYRNIIGRAARAFRATEGFAILLESGRARARWLRRQFWEADEAALSVESPSLRILGERSVDSYRANLLLESQILGHVGDATLAEGEEGSAIAGRTLASVTEPHLTERLAGAVDHQLERLETGVQVTPIQRGSPLELTDFGRTCLRTGLSFEACEFFRTRLEGLMNDDLEALTQVRDLEKAMREETLVFLLSMALQNPDLYADTIELNQIRGETPAEAEALRTAAIEQIQARPTLPDPDHRMIREWLAGSSVMDIWRTNKPNAHDEPARLSGDNYSRTVSDRFAWGYFGFLSILGYLQTEHSVEVSPEIRLFYRYLKTGVSDPVALLLHDHPGLRVDRRLATAISRHYPETFTGEETTTSVAEWLFSASEQDLAEWLGEEPGSEIFARIEALRSI